MKQKKVFALLLLWMGIIPMVAAQSLQTYSGKVFDSATDEPVIGASVKIVGTTSGTITDVDGSFSVEAAPDAMLEFSYVGYVTQQVKVAPNMVISLAEGESILDEVIVTGYGTSTRAQFVGSAKAIKSDELTNRATSNVTNALSGKVAGVQVIQSSGQPGDGAKIRIRGIGSINGGTEPLYIVDGAPIDASSINLISSYDIESMTVLKDASSTSIYGARGANGVVLITTKSGKSDSKFTVNVDAKWGTNQRGVPNYNVITDPAQYYELGFTALYNSQIYNGVSATDAYRYANSNFFTQSGVGYQVYTVPEGENVIGTNLKLNPNAKLGYVGYDQKGNAYYYTPDNWEKETFNSKNLRQEYNINISGGNTNTQYFVSLGYLSDPGLINGSKFDRFTGRAKVESQVKKWLRIGASANYAHSNYQNPGYQSSWGSTGNVFYAANGMAPYLPFYVRNADGSVKVDANGYTVYDTGTNTGQTRPGGAPQGNNAINLNIDKNNTVTDYFNGLFYLTVTPIEGLNISARLTPDYYGSYSNELSNPFYGSTSNGGSVYVGSERFFAFNQQYTISYKKAFADVHRIEAQVGWETYSLKDQNVYASNDHLFNPFVAELNNAYGVTPTSTNAHSSTETYSTAGLLASVKYDLMDRYFVNATFRYDASSRFSKKNRWGAFGSVGAAWLINRENWMQNAKWIDELKLKASWGTNGNDKLGNYYVYQNMFDIAYNSETGEFSKTLSQIGNEDLKWESQMMSNVGVEFSFLKSRLNGNIEYYNRQNDNMLFYISNPPSSGFGSLSTPKNVGKITNQGLEFDIEGVLLDMKNVRWSVFMNLTYNKGVVNKLADAYLKDDGSRWFIYNSSTIIKEGGTLAQAYMREYAGVDQATGKALYYIDPENHDLGTTSTYSEAKEGNIGDISAKVFGGFGTALECYGVDVNVQFSYQAGGKAYDGGYQQTMHAGDQLGYAWNKDILKAWTPANTNTDVPRICSSDSYNQETSSRWLVSSDYVSLNNVTVGYTLPQKWTKKAKIEKVRFFFQGDNLALWSARQGFDPRQSQNNRGVGVAGSTSSGNYVYSTCRTLSGGLSITF